MLENTIYHGPSESNKNKQYFPRPSTRQTPGTDSHFSNKKKPHVTPISNKSAFISAEDFFGWRPWLN